MRFEVTSKFYFPFSLVYKSFGLQPHNDGNIIARFALVYCVIYLILWNHLRGSGSSGYLRNMACWLWNHTRFSPDLTWAPIAALLKMVWGSRFVYTAAPKWCIGIICYGLRQQRICRLGSCIKSFNSSTISIFSISSIFLIDYLLRLCSIILD